MPVVEVRDQLMVEPNHVYVIPPDRSMIIVRGQLQLLPREGRGVHHPIDQFFRSLAAEQRHQAIGVVLSGTATDGTMGLEEIKAEGGITFAQDATAQHEGMPHSAIASGCVDFVLPPDEIAREIGRISQHPYAVLAAETRAKDEKPNLAQVVQLLFQATGVDFTGYKFNTLYRRVTRRMVFQKIERTCRVRTVPAEDAGGSGVALSGHSDQRHQLLPRPGVIRGSEEPGVSPPAQGSFPARPRKTLDARLLDRAGSLLVGDGVHRSGRILRAVSAPFQLFASDLNCRRHRESAGGRLFQGHRSGRLGGTTAAVFYGS